VDCPAFYIEEWHIEHICFSFVHIFFETLSEHKSSTKCTCFFITKGHIWLLIAQ
jgi:hypothetical protein